MGKAADLSYTFDCGSEVSLLQEPSLFDPTFLNVLENHRGKGRNDYPIDLLWKGLLAMIACRATSVEEMRRKMKEWPDLFPKIPTSFSFSRFFSFLSRFSFETESLLLRRAGELPADYGRVMAIARLDQIHFLFDPEYRLAYAFHWKEPNETGIAAAQMLLERTRAIHPAFFERCQYLLADASYDGLTNIAWDRYKIRAIVPLKDPGKQCFSFRDAFYDEQGVVYCDAPGGKRAMIYAGLEEKRNTLKYRCMARHYGTECEKMASCSLRSGIRIPLSLNEKIFAPLPRASYRFSQLYSLYSSREYMTKMLESYLSLAKTQDKKILCCRLASLLLIAAQSRNTKV